ncbi:transposase, partial [Roseofilum sp. Guam]|uniref:transposase n=1 Tax=Roseofilum sp. Guam TaxID=2821502 RepID=UPI001B287343
FLSILEWVAAKKSKRVVYIDRWFPSSKTCSECGYVLNELKLKERQWSCPSCSTEHDRDLNAALNIKSVGASTDSLGFSQTVPDCYCCLSGESPYLQVGEYVNIASNYNLTVLT